jgi:hypothetical protein
MASAIPLTVGSQSSAPDLDWSQMRETVRMLNLAVAQIEASMREGDDSVLALTDSFTSMASAIASVRALLAEDEQIADPVSAQIEDKCASLSQKIHAAIVAFQFYDKLTQKLSHVSKSLNSLGELVSDHGRLYNPAEWCGLQEKIRSAYTVADERELFDALMRGMSIEEAMSMAKARKTPEADADSDVELF